MSSTFYYFRRRNYPSVFIIIFISSLKLLLSDMELMTITVGKNQEWIVLPTKTLPQCSLLNPSTTSCPSASKWKNESDTSHSFLKNRFLTVHSHKLMMKQAQNHDDHGVPSNTTVKCQRFVCFFCFVYCRCCCHFLQKFTRNNGLIWESQLTQSNVSHRIVVWFQ